MTTEEMQNIQNYRSEVRDGMLIDWDVPIEMEDGVTLRADIYRPNDTATHPVIISYGPYGKWLHFQDGYPYQWKGWKSTILIFWLVHLTDIKIGNL